jgi:hypothetical protein
MSITIDDALNVLRNHKIEGNDLTAIAKDLIAIEKELKAEKEANKEEKPKTNMVVLIRGDAALKKAVQGGAFIVTVPENSDNNTFLARLAAAVKTSNDSIKRGKSSRAIRTFARAMEWLKPKALKQHQIKGIKTKTPVEVIVVESADI